LTTSTLGVDYFWTPIMAYFSVPIDRTVESRGAWHVVECKAAYFPYAVHVVRMVAADAVAGLRVAAAELEAIE